MTAMEPIRDTKATLVDLLDRVLDKGLVIHADLIVSVAGVPLIGVNLRAALAGMETMQKYGMMVEDDMKIRAQAEKKEATFPEKFLQEEKVLFKASGTFWDSEGMCNAWRRGQIHVTEKRILLYQPFFETLLLDRQINEIENIMIKEDDPRQIFLGMGKDETIALKSENGEKLTQILKEISVGRGLDMKIETMGKNMDGISFSFIKGKEKIIVLDNFWLKRENWTPGTLYLTKKELCFWSATDRKLCFTIPRQMIQDSFVTRQKLLGERDILNVSYREDSKECLALLTTGVTNKSIIEKWTKILGDLSWEELLA